MTVNAFWGNRGGCLGETSAAAIIGGVYLLIRKTISWHIPASVLLSAGRFRWLPGCCGRNSMPVLCCICLEAE